MAGEYPMLKSFGVDSIEAYDTAEGMYQKFLEFQPNPEIPVTYHVMDVNEIHLEEGAFDVIYIQHAYHHFERIEHVAEEISKALKPSGVFVITDWIGPNFLQRTPAQLAVMNNLWHHMPAKWQDRSMVEREFPVVISKYVQGARKIEFDGVGRNGQVINYAISEHVEDAGTHSGDATLLLPAQRLHLETHRRVMHIASSARF
ncbi:unnamed protein product [Effrenium voratum]|uniref:Methyltransferase type 11 domain-containing protein n=1 Tax=Effrenium voratum TaxID=2562239 RepID=A0AA36IPC1_9DINO|nr:unnamed protein product [Effrenium voratum]